MNASRPPRILHCITWFRLGGAERVAVSLASELHPRFEFAVHAILGVPPDAFGRDLQAKLRAHHISHHAGPRLPVKFGGLLTGALSLLRTIDRVRPDIIHLHTEIPEATYAVALTLRPRLKSIPVVRTIHNSRYWHHWSAIGRWTHRRLPPAHIIGVSHDALSAFESHARSCGDPSAPRGTRVIYNGVVPPPHLPASAVRSPLRLLFAARFDYQKGADLLPEILSHLASARLPACALTVAGDGDLADNLRDLARHAPPNWTVELRSPIQNLDTHLPDFDLVLMPSRFEGLGLLAIETLMRKIPLVATRASGLRETFPPDYPWLAEPGSATAFAHLLQLALGSRAEWSAVAERAQSFALARFSLSKTVARYAEIYSQIRPTA